MADAIFVVVALGFFGLCVAYVRGLERMVTAADESGDAAETIEATDEAGAR